MAALYMSHLYPSSAKRSGSVKASEAVKDWKKIKEGCKDARTDDRKHERMKQ
jgi:hypothetical protein